VVVMYSCVSWSSLAHYDVDSVLDRWDLDSKAVRCNRAFFLVICDDVEFNSEDVHGSMFGNGVWTL
jgi:hypothetical protein